MEVGAVKQAFNNEVILLKKNLNQAKIQIIHKLTRKAKTFAEKKCPEPLKEKLKRKAESAVKEVLLIKKIKPRDIAKFIVTHKGKLSDYLNKPIVDNDKACARLLLHKALASKYQIIRDRFSNVSIHDLLMSRQERRQLKKEAKEKQENKKKKRANSETDNVGGVWDVEVSKSESNNDDHNSDQDASSNENGSEDENKIETDEESVSDQEMGQESDTDRVIDNKIKVDTNNQKSNSKTIKSEKKKIPVKNDDIEEEIQTSDEEEVQNNIESNIQSKPINNKIMLNKPDKKPNKNAEKRLKDNNKNKNLNEKMKKRKFNKDLNDLEEQKSQIADPFFITSTGANYMSLVEPRQPDEVKEVHKEGNRKYRRAVMFGLVPKPRRNDFRQNSKQNHQNQIKNRTNDFKSNGNIRNYNSISKVDRNEKDSNDVIPEKLHPSWEAKKRQSTIVPFKGKKIMFDDS